jgi:uncharacterized protein (TIGR02271 family)
MRASFTWKEIIMAKSKDNENTKGRDANRDPITKQPGSHPVGTGIGAAAGGVAGGAAAGAAMGSAAGPVGTGIGIVAGAVVGGLAGKGIAEKIDPTAEDAYWREQYKREPYYDSSFGYEDYQGAYRTGYEGYRRLGGQGKSYEDAEPQLRQDYEREAGRSRLSWEKARPAVQAAWRRFDRNLEDYIGYDVTDRNGKEIGTAECLWADHTGEPAFLGVRTGWFLGRTHVVPAQQVEVSQSGRRIRLPYSEEQVKQAPSYEPGDELSDAQEQEVYSYYGIRSAQPAQVKPARAEEHPEADITLAEEHLKVGKREVEAGGVRLRKVIRRETVNQPVELKREEVIIERVPGREGQASQAFQDQEIYIPLRREEVVVEKEARVREQVRVRKTSETDQQEVSEEVRKEDIEIERSGEASTRFDPEDSSTGPGQAMKDRETRPRSQRQLKD